LAAWSAWAIYLNARAMFTHRLDDDRWLRIPEDSDAKSSTS